MDSQDIVALILVAAVVIFFTYCARSGRREKNKEKDSKDQKDHVKSRFGGVEISVPLCISKKMKVLQ